jgi:hypothetical protein
MIKDSLPIAVSVGIAIAMYAQVNGKPDSLHDGLVAAGLAFVVALVWDAVSTLVFRRRR